MSASSLQVPPDGVGGKTSSASFKDKLVGERNFIPVRKRVNLIEENLAKFEFLDGDRLFPVVSLDKKVMERICVPWKDALVVKLLGKDIGFLTMRDQLKKLWNPIGGFDIIDMEEDHLSVVEGGPQMLFDHYLSAQTWSIDFVASSAKVQKTMVWIRFPDLNVAYYDEDVLFTLV